MTRSTRPTRTAWPLLAAAALALTLAGCAAPAPEATTTPAPEATAGGPCEQVSVVVDFGPLDEPSIAACAAAGPALDVLDEAGVVTEGTADYGNAVVCRVNNTPSPDEPVELDGEEPFTESCDTLNSLAYWALWVRNSPDGEWEYAQSGVDALELADGQSVGLVYTPGTESIPPQG
jgi:hypothetical protein